MPDRLQMPPDRLEQALRRFGRGPAAVPRQPDEPVAAMFWQMIGASVDSVQETRRLNDLVREHRWFAARAARGFARLGDVDDLEQEALIELPRVLERFIPSRGRLSWYVTKSCRK